MIKLNYYLEYAALRLCCPLIRALPGDFAVKLGGKAGTLSAKLLQERIKLAHSNLELAFGSTLSHEQQEEIIHNLMEMLGEALVESIIFTPRDIEKHITVEGMEHLKNALKTGRGAIIIGPHFGQWELASFVFGQHLKKATIVYKALKNPLVNDYLLQKRKESGVPFISSKKGLRQVFSCLKKNYMVGLVFDQNAGRHGLPAAFFGKTAFTYTTPAAFASKTGCEVLPAYLIKGQGFRKYRMIIKEPFPLINTGNMEKDLMSNTQQYNDFIETLVRTHPEQWFGWLHRRWKIPRNLQPASKG